MMQRKNDGLGFFRGLIFVVVPSILCWMIIVSVVYFATQVMGAIL